MNKPWLEAARALLNAGTPAGRMDAAKVWIIQTDALVRALLAVEHPENGEKDIYGKRVEECPSCLRRRDACGEFEHTTACRTDDALRFVGLPDQASRDEARREMAKK